MHLFQPFSAEELQNRLLADRKLTAIGTGVFIGLSAAVIGLLLSLGGPLLAFGALLGIGVGLYVLTNLTAGLALTLAVIALLPYGTLPVRVALVPTVLDVALGGFLLVYVMQWMTGKRIGSRMRLVPAHGLILAFMLYAIFCFIAGLGHAQLTSSVLRKFVELLLSMLTAIVIADVARDEAMLRRIVLTLVLAAGVQAAVGMFLYFLNDLTAERLLNTLSRFGYPAGGVIRYIEDDPTLPERAIGTWIDPNSYGGFLMMTAALAGIQILSPRPVLKRWIVMGIFGLETMALWFTHSRGALAALVGLLMIVAVLRYRWLLVVIVVALVLVLMLPFTQAYIERFTEGLTGQDLSTQMRLGEYKDALILVGRYPVIGVGFAGTPDRDIYLGVSMMYLKIAGAMGLSGLLLFFVVIGETYRYGLSKWKLLQQSPVLFNLWLGFAAGLLGALFSGVFDHYYFNIEFQAAGLMFWLYVGLSLAAARAAVENAAVQGVDPP